MSKFVLGFPVVVLIDDKKNCIPVFVHASDDAPGVYWNAERLSLSMPFADPYLNRIFEQVAKSVAVCFRSSSLSAGQMGTVKIEASSATLLGELFARYVFPPWNADTDTLSILLSGVYEQRGEKVLPLAVHDETQKKAECARKFGAYLLMHPEDCKGIASPTNLLPRTLRQLSFQRGHSSMEWIYPLPINPKGLWDYNNTGQTVVDGLAEWLGLERRNGNVEIFESAAHELHELLRLALPTSLDYVDRIIQIQKTAWEGAIVPGGMAEALFERLSTSPPPPFFPEYGAVQNVPHILLGGPTGCGKTTVAELFMLNMAIEQDRPVVYVAPTRSLVNERYATFIRKYCDEELLFARDVLRSSGEFPENDGRIRAGDFRVAMIVNEKADLFLSSGLREQGGLLGKMGLLAVDEIHMLSNEQRGGALDTLLARVFDHNRISSPKTCRIVAISTEQTIDNTSIVEAVTQKDVRGNHVAPLVLAAARRPIPLRHKLVWPRCSAPTDIVSFEYTKDRYLSAPTAKSLLINLRNQVLATIGSDIKDDADNNLVNLIEAQAKIHDVLLVCVNSSFRIRRLVDLHLRMRQSYRELSVPPALSRALLNLEDRDEEKRVLGLAKKGIYVHVSDTHMSVREVIEAHFASVEASGRALVLYTTETLTYGVNLSVDCVILADLDWPRADYDREDILRRWLQPSEFHNLLGRAGRFGKTKSRWGEALICVKSFNETSRLIEEYYIEKPDELSSLSAAILEADLRKLEDDKLAVIDDISFPSMRTVVALMRHIGGGESKYLRVRDILALFRSLLYWIAASDYQRQNTEMLVHKILELASNSEVQPRLILKQEDGPGSEARYQAQSQAFALIDTGTHFSSLRPIRYWLNCLRDLRLDNPPVELVLPGLICARDFWMQGRAFCWEERAGDKDRGLEAFTANATEAESVLHEELLELNLSASDVTLVIEAIRQLATTCIDLGDLGETSRAEFREPMLMRLCAAALKWVRGERFGEITSLSDLRNAHNRRPFAQKYCDRLNWLAVLCWRCFADLSQEAPEEFQRMLPRFARRLMWGVPKEGVPYHGADALDSPVVSREYIRNLLAAGITPEKVLSAAKPTELFNYVSNQVLMEPKRLVDKVFAFFASEVESIKHLMSHQPSVDIIWREYCDLIRKLLLVNSGSRTSGGGVPVHSLVHETLRLFRELLKDGQAEKGEYQLLESEGENVIGVRLSPDVLVQFYVCSHSEGGLLAVPDEGVFVNVPWSCRQASEMNSPAKEMTAMGALVLLSFIARGYVGHEAILDWQRKGRPGSWRVQDLLQYFSFERQGARDLPGEIRERLLAFYEPGVPA